MSECECILARPVTKTLTQSVTSVLLFSKLEQPEYSISNWVLGGSDINAWKNVIPNLYINLHHKESRKVSVCLQNNSTCSVEAKIFSPQR